jgi:hypothetical protein
MNREEHKDAIEVSVIFHEGQKMFAVPKQPAPVQEPVAWRYDLKQTGSFAGVSTEYSPVKLSIGENWTPLYTTPPAQEIVCSTGLCHYKAQPDWKAEYLKSVESGCITLDELRETLAELEATNRQVEILSDALAESRREVAALKSVQESCKYCDGTGDVHDQTGEWRGTCHCVKAAQRQWVGLTDEDIKIEIDESGLESHEYGQETIQLIYAIEAKLREKNT